MGIDVRESADILIRRCHIHSCVVGGMLVHKLGCANIEESLICDNDGVGVEVNSNDFTLIRGCMINSNGCHGFHARNASAAIIEDCDLTDNTPKRCKSTAFQRPATAQPRGLKRGGYSRKPLQITRLFISYPTETRVP
jgi:hypothetical protein